MTAKKTDWVVIVLVGTHHTIRETHWHCQRCGERVVIPTPLAIATFAELSNGYVRAHQNCREGSAPVEPPPFTGDAHARAMAWKTRGECGMSSIAIWEHMVFGRTVDADARFPLDPDDFRRCRLLLEAVPEWRPRMGQMARYGKEWAALAGAWEELDALFTEEVTDRTGRKVQMAPRMYARMQELHSA